MFDLDFPRAHGGCLGSAIFRAQAQDFQVVEDLGVPAEGEGEHCYLWVRKTGSNTQWVAKQLAAAAGIKPSDVGYCGLKDRHAVTWQWFSLYLPHKPDIDWQAFAEQYGQAIVIEQLTQGRKKLRRGQHRANRFVITLRDVTAHGDALERRLALLAERGVPNYFGEQRFGREGNNLQLAQRWLVEGERIRARALKQMTMSAARSYVFNRVLAERVLAGNWDTAIAGDVLLAGSPTAPLWGRGYSATSEQAAQIEQRGLHSVSAWLDGLEHCGLNQERRATVLQPQDLQWHFQQAHLELSFALAPGQYATALLRELVELASPEPSDGQPHSATSWG